MIKYNTPPCFTPAARLFIIKAAGKTPRQIYAGAIFCRRSGIISAAGDAIREQRRANFRTFGIIATSQHLTAGRQKRKRLRIYKAIRDNAEGCILDGMKRGRQLQGVYISDRQGAPVAHDIYTAQQIETTQTARDPGAAADTQTAGQRVIIGNVSNFTDVCKSANIGNYRTGKHGQKRKRLRIFCNVSKYETGAAIRQRWRVYKAIRGSCRAIY